MTCKVLINSSCVLLALGLGIDTDKMMKNVAFFFIQVLTINICLTVIESGSLNDLCVHTNEHKIE